MDTKDLISYSQASRDTRRSAATYGRQAFQIRHSLVKFMAEDDVRSFREVMRRTGTVITGSVVVHFFARTSVGDADLDLVVDVTLAGISVRIRVVVVFFDELYIRICHLLVEIRGVVLVNPMTELRLRLTALGRLFGLDYFFIGIGEIIVTTCDR